MGGWSAAYGGLMIWYLTIYRSPEPVEGRFPVKRASTGSALTVKFNEM
jgi:hypothetical protein